MRSLYLFGLTFALAGPVHGAFRIPDAPASSWKRAANGEQYSKLLAKLYVSNYDGNVTTFHLGTTSDNALVFSPFSKNTDCGAQPTWLDYDPSSKTLYCLNEQWDPSAGNATLSKYTVAADGTLKLDKKVDTAYGGPVHVASLSGGAATACMAARKGLRVVAHYEPGGLSAVDQDLNPVFSANLSAGPPAPGALPNQLGSHVHEAIVDPTGKYVFSPDLGQDRVWIAGYDQIIKGRQGEDSSSFASFAVPKQTGPRHGVFVPGQAGRAMFYVVGEISNKIVSFNVAYKNGKPNVSGPVSQVSSLNAEAKQGYAAGELALSPDRKFIIASNRNNSLSAVESCDDKMANCEKEAADTLVTFKMGANGSLEPVQTWSAGGMLPRAFGLNKKGDMVAVGLVSRVVIMERDPKTAKIGQVIADMAFDTPSAVTNIVWDER